MKILIVEDEKNLQLVLKYNLEMDGNEVVCAGDGQEGLSMVDETIDLVLMDVMMPGINGVQAFQQMKHFNKDAKAIFMSAFALDDLKDQAINDGAVAFLYKPIDPDQLINLLEQLSPEKAG